MHHHPDEEQLIAYAAGTQTAAVEVLMASHLTLCPACRVHVGELEDIGGAMLDVLAPEAPDAQMLDRLMTMLDDDGPAGTIVTEDRSSDPAEAVTDGLLLPRPLRRHIGADINRLDWRVAVRGVERAPLTIDNGSGHSYLLRAQPGCFVPPHRHTGSELVLVLDGAYSDAYGHYERGDFTMLASDMEHRPLADPDGVCLCLIVADGPIRLTGRLARFLNPFIS
jgi:putative transcriptional regulator